MRVNKYLDRILHIKKEPEDRQRDFTNTQVLAGAAAAGVYSSVYHNRLLQRLSEDIVAQDLRSSDPLSGNIAEDELRKHVYNISGSKGQAHFDKAYSSLNKIEGEAANHAMSQINVKQMGKANGLDMSNYNHYHSPSHVSLVLPNQASPEQKALLAEKLEAAALSPINKNLGSIAYNTNQTHALHEVGHLVDYEHPGQAKSLGKLKWLGSKYGHRVGNIIGAGMLLDDDTRNYAAVPVALGYFPKLRAEHAASDYAVKYIKQVAGDKAAASAKSTLKKAFNTYMHGPTVAVASTIGAGALINILENHTEKT